MLVRPSRYRQFGDAEDSVFCLVTNSAISDYLDIEQDGSYRDYVRVMFEPGDSFESILSERVPQCAHVLVISPHCFFRSPKQELIGPRRKLMAMACNSTPTSVEAIAHFLETVERTEPYAQEAFADRFFELGEASDYLEMIDEASGTRAVFEHLNESYVWNQQAGPVQWGSQQIVPAGEISVLPIEIIRFDASLRLALNGEISFQGHPVLHSGTPSFLPQDQSRIFARLTPLREHAVVATVENGFITRLRPTHPNVETTVRMLEAMFEVDSRYQIIWEIGFAINSALDILPGNFAMNEVYGGTNGYLHWGLGLTPFTQYHFDITCPGTKVYGNRGDLLIGAK